MDLRDLTQYAAVSERTLRAWIHFANDPLPASRVSGKILVNRLAFDAWMVAHTLKPDNSPDRTGPPSKEGASACLVHPNRSRGEFERRLAQPLHKVK